MVQKTLDLVTYAAYLCLPDTSAERDLQKVLQQLEPQITFLEELTKMGGAMRTVLTKILTNQQTYKELSMGNCFGFMHSGSLDAMHLHLTLFVHFSSK